MTWWQQVRSLALVALGLTVVQVVAGGLVFPARAEGGPSALPARLLG